MNPHNPECDIGGCPAVRTPHAHLPEADRTWRPSNRLTISEEARQIAAVILASYDGRTALERAEAAAERTDQSFLLELSDIELSSVPE